MMTDTTARCVVCRKPMPDDAAYVCPGDALSLAETLTIAAGHAEDAQAVLSRQARYGGGGRGGSSEPLPVDLTASARLDVVENTISTWARHVADERRQQIPPWQPLVGAACRPRGPEHHVHWQGHRCPHASCETIRSQVTPGNLAQAAAWLATHTDWLRRRPEAAEAFDELHHACHQLARLVDRPPDKDLVGMCDCGKVLYATPGRSVVTCPVTTCKLRWEVAESREILRRALDGKLVTAAEAARLGAYLDTDRNQQQIRKLINTWHLRRQVFARGQVVEDDGFDEHGEPKTRTVPTFRFGDVAERLARTPRRAARAAESETAA